jgi:dephospho-CoA kinase
LKIVGLTGGVASGKTTVANMLRELGAKIVDADELARRAVARGTLTFQKIVEEFGNDFLDKNGELDRKKLGRYVFNDATRKEKLEKIIHPVIGKMLIDSIESEREKKTEILILDIPLLFENNMQMWIRPVILVYTNPEKQIERLMKRENLSESEALNIIKSQMPIEEKKKLADFIIDNNDDLIKTESQVKIIWQELQK